MSPAWIAVAVLVLLVGVIAAALLCTRRDPVEADDRYLDELAEAVDADEVRSEWDRNLAAELRRRLEEGDR